MGQIGRGGGNLAGSGSHAKVGKNLPKVIQFAVPTAAFTAPEEFQSRLSVNLDGRQAGQPGSVQFLGPAVADKQGAGWVHPKSLTGKKIDLSSWFHRPHLKGKKNLMKELGKPEIQEQEERTTGGIADQSGPVTWRALKGTEGLLGIQVEGCRVQKNLLLESDRPGQERPRNLPVQTGQHVKESIPFRLKIANLAGLPRLHPETKK